jgi:hypothetical protein
MATNTNSADVSANAPEVSSFGDALPSARKTPREYFARTPARFLKDPNISPGAKLLRVLLTAFADERTCRTFVTPRRLDRLMDCEHKYRERLQRELVAAGWLKLEGDRKPNGHLGRRIYCLCAPPMPVSSTSGRNGPSKESIPSI